MYVHKGDNTQRTSMPQEKHLSENAAKLTEENPEFICGLCKRYIKDPRLMLCLHSFCLECLRVLESEFAYKASLTKSSGNKYSPDQIKKKWMNIVTCAGNTSDMFGISNSAYECEDGTREKYEPAKPKTLKCPTCNFNNILPERGVVDLPHNYLLQYRILIDKLNNGNIHLLCDLCQGEVVAQFRCTKCLQNLCSACSQAHTIQNRTSDHEIVSFKTGRESGSCITKIRRQAMCPAHPQNDIKFYCQSCNKMTCNCDHPQYNFRKCSLVQHRDHTCGLLSKAARMYRRKIKEVIDQTTYVVREAETTRTYSESIFQELLSNCVTVKKDIDTYINSYIEALEEHRKDLKRQVEQTKSAELQILKQELVEVEKKQRECNHALKFGEDLLAEGSDFEIISLGSPLLKRLEWIIQSGPIKSKIKSKSSRMLQFLADERAGIVKNHPVFGIVTSQIVSPIHSSLTVEGLNSLKNCTVKQQCFVKLVTRDYNNKPVHHGTGNIEMDLRYTEKLNRQVPVLAVDQQDGTYLITFTPDSPGNMCLSITIRGQPIRGSPFFVQVRKPRVHRGVFHCCTFCSSGGSKKALCGCGGRMPGGYLGCGHGHYGHPGKKHWSCCGSTFPNSECNRKSSGTYLLSF